jgi:hypothetical protein
MYLIDCARSKYKDDCTNISHITPLHAVEFDRYVSHDKDDGMPSTTPAANTVVVAVPSLV